MIATEAAALISHLRGGQDGRVAWLLDITTDLGVPAFAALSVDGNGRQLARSGSTSPTYAGGSVPGSEYSSA